MAKVQKHTRIVNGKKVTVEAHDRVGGPAAKATGATTPTLNAAINRPHNPTNPPTPTTPARHLAPPTKPSKPKKLAELEQTITRREAAYEKAKAEYREAYKNSGLKEMKEQLKNLDASIEPIDAEQSTAHAARRKARAAGEDIEAHTEKCDEIDMKAAGVNSQIFMLETKIRETKRKLNYHEGGVVSAERDALKVLRDSYSRLREDPQAFTTP